jgi:hypothetical protein
LRNNSSVSELGDMVRESLLGLEPGLFEAGIEGHIDILVLASDLDGAYPTGKTGYGFSVAYRANLQILSRRIDISLKTGLRRLLPPINIGSDWPRYFSRVLSRILRSVFGSMKKLLACRFAMSEATPEG